ncbi:MAG: hypothetical protein QOF21_3007 [Actinomycetota bacterium]
MPGEIGAGLTVPTQRTVPTTSVATKATSRPACPNTDPTSEVRYDDWSVTITLTVSKLCPVHADDISFTMKVTNKSAAVLHYDANQTQFFTIKAPRGENKHRWTDTDCNKPIGGGDKPAANLAAGATISFSGVYPGPPGKALRDECRQLERGAYDAGGVFLLCEGEAYTDGYCDTSKDVQLFAQPVRITLDP